MQLSDYTVKQDSKYARIYCLILNIIWIAGFLLFYQSITTLNIIYLAIISFIIIVSYSLIDYFIDEKKRKYLLFAFIMIGIVCLFSFIYRGLFGFIQCVINLYNIQYEDAIQLSMSFNITQLDMYIFSTVLMMIVCYYVFVCMKKSSLILLHLFFFIICFISFWLGVFSYAVMTLMILSQIALWIMNFNDDLTRRIRIWLLSLSALMIALGTVFSYHEVQSIALVKALGSKKIETIRYGQDTLPQGELSLASMIHSDQKVRLNVSSLQIKDMYLKGFVGSRLVDNKWTDLKKADYNGSHQGMLQWLENKNFNLTQQFNQYLPFDQNQKVKKNKIVVENIAANKRYYYAPYSLKNQTRNNISQVKDLNLVSTNLFGIENYEYEEYSQNLPCELLNTTDLTKQTHPSQSLVLYNKCENIYRQFAYEKYLDVDRSLYKSIQSLFDQREFKNTGIYSVTQHIRQILTQNMTYTEKQVKHKNDNELLAFINETHQGNDVLFASLAVEAFRYYGIPSRYVEGYYVKNSDFNSHGQATLTSKNAHAWVEVYFDGIGWMPLDVTPGYYYDTYALMSMLDQSQGVKEASAKKNDKEKAKEVDSQGGMTVLKQAQKVIKTVESILVGVVSLLGVLCIVFVVLLELRRILYQIKLYNLYTQSKQDQKTRILYLIVKRMLVCYGVDCYIGWHDQENDDLLVRLGVIHKGEYVRMIHLLEKFFYGEMSLELYQFNIILHFVEQLYRNRNKLSIKQKLRLRFVLIDKNLFKQIQMMDDKGGEKVG